MFSDEYYFYHWNSMIYFFYLEFLTFQTVSQDHQQNIDNINYIIDCFLINFTPIGTFFSPPPRKEHYLI